MSKKKITPKEVSNRTQQVVAKKEGATRVLTPRDGTSNKEMTEKEFLLKRTEVAIKLITNSLEIPNAKQLEKVVLEMSSIGLPRIENFVAKFVAKYPDPIFQNQIFDIVLRKIEISASLENSTVFKSEVLLAKAKAIITINSTEERNQIRLENATEALNLLESANALQNPEIAGLIEESIKALITMHLNPLEAFQLAKDSVEFRKTHLDTYHPSILEAYITTAQVGHKIDVRAIKIEALNKANAAYNMALQLGSKTHAAVALTFMASIYKDFGDVQKSIILLEQSDLLKEVLRDEESKEEGSRVPVKSPHAFEVIKKHGVNDDLTLTIKQKIQKSVLNPVYEASKNGLWVHKIALIEYGTSGYVNEVFLAKALGSLNTTENVNLALMLCFEAINLGIMSSPIYNPICAVAFVQQHPTLVPTMVATNPEYFINEHIVKSTLLSASTYAPELLGKNVAVNGSYNKYLEAIMMPIIGARINDTVLNPISILIKSGKWDLSVQEQLLRYASEDYLTGVGRIYTSILGQNLSTLEDALTISRILMFKVIVDTIKESGSKNYAPVETFAKHYSNVIKRIFDDHSDYMTNPHIIDICQQAISAPLLDVIQPELAKVVEPVLEEGAAASSSLLKVEPVLEVALLGGEGVTLIDS